MPALRKTPLAWKNLTHDKRRLAVALAGIGFAVLLMFTQVGFQNALFDSQVKVIDDIRGDIFLISPAKYTLAAEKRFPRARLDQAQSVGGVTGAYPVYSELTLSVLKDLAPGARSNGFPIRALGFNLNDPVFESKQVQQQINLLRIPNTALIDQNSKEKNFDFPTQDVSQLKQHPTELASQRVQLVGTFDMGTDFAHDGNLIMSAKNFAKYFPQRKQFGDPLSVVDLGVIQIESDKEADRLTIKDRIDRILPNDVEVLTKNEYRAKEISFWDKSTPIGVVFAAGKVIGFIVGVVICYQVIYTDIADHMSEFATLRAMGYKNSYFIRLIVNEGVLLALIGFIPGWLVSCVIYNILAKVTGLQLQMTLPSAALVLALTIAMCIASGLLAVRKLLSVDPASLF